MNNAKIREDAAETRKDVALSLCDNQRIKIVETRHILVECQDKLLHSQNAKFNLQNQILDARASSVRI